MRLEYFEMIDRVVRVDLEGKRIEAAATTPDASPVFEGHFPDHPLVPGVLLTETMAQAAGYLLLAIASFERMPFLMGVDKARFRAFVGPGADLSIAAHVEHEGSGYAVAAATIDCDGKRLCDAQLRFRIMPFPDGVADAMRARADAIGLTDPRA